MVVNSLNANLASFLAFNVQCWESKTFVWGSSIYYCFLYTRPDHSSICPSVFLTSICISSGLSQKSGLHCACYCLHTENMVLPQKAYSLGIWQINWCKKLLLGLWRQMNWTKEQSIIDNNRNGTPCNYCTMTISFFHRKTCLLFPIQLLVISVLPTASGVIKFHHHFPSFESGVSYF